MYGKPVRHSYQTMHPDRNLDSGNVAIGVAKLGMEYARSHSFEIRLKSQSNVSRPSTGHETARKSECRVSMALTSHLEQLLRAER